MSNRAKSQPTTGEGTQRATPPQPRVEVPSRPTRSFRSVLLGYEDPESGEQVLIDVRASGSFPRAEFLRGIEQRGFVVLADDGSTPREVTPKDVAG